MDLGAIVNSLFEDEPGFFHDAVFDATGVSHPKEKLKELFYELPKNIQMTAFEWGLNDTVFRDEVFVYVTKHLAADKQIQVNEMAKMKQLAIEIEERRDEIEEIESRICAKLSHPHTMRFMSDEADDVYKEWFVNKFTDDKELAALALTKMKLENNA